jgi:hypothetical protein
MEELFGVVYPIDVSMVHLDSYILRCNKSLRSANGL